MDTEAPTPERLKYYRFERGGWTVATAAELCGVTVATYRRYESGAVRIPVSVFRLVQVVCGGQLPHADWTGWTLRDGWFYSPENVGFSTGEIRALPLLHALIAELKRTAVRPAARPKPRLARIA